MKFRFNIRDLLWLVVVAALAVGWWFDSRGRIRQRNVDAKLDAIEQALDRAERLPQQGGPNRRR
jgi:hypothetical protein